jgi:hypothetical protein
MAHVKKNGYVGGAALVYPHIRKMREMVEFQKFQCRVLVDDERTRAMKKNTEEHPDSLHAMRYNSERANSLTSEGKKNGSNQGS